MLMASWLPKELTPIMPECAWLPAREVSWLGLRGTLYRASAMSAARFRMMSWQGRRQQWHGQPSVRRLPGLPRASHTLASALLSHWGRTDSLPPSLPEYDLSQHPPFCAGLTAGADWAVDLQQHLCLLRILKPPQERSSGCCQEVQASKGPAGTHLSTPSHGFPLRGGGRPPLSKLGSLAAGAVRAWRAPASFRCPQRGKWPPPAPGHAWRSRSGSPGSGAGASPSPAWR